MEVDSAAGGVLVVFPDPPGLAAPGTGCRDVATGLPLRLPLSAPLDAAVVSPITSLVEPFSSSTMAQAEWVSA